MTTLFKKLNFKDHDPIAILQSPDSFISERKAMQAFARIDAAWKEGVSYPFVLVFVETQAALTAFAAQLPGKLAEDAILWVAYPKRSSKKYRSDIGRDEGWQPLGDLGYEGVRMVAIDADWSALRLRETRYIKTMKRDPKRSMSKEGRKRTNE